MNLSELLTENVARFGEYSLLHYKGKAITNRELDRLVNRVASGLVELGVKPGERVTLIMGNSPELLIAMFACFKIGAWAMPVVLSLRPPELALVLNDAEPSTLIAQRIFSERIQEPAKEDGGIRYRVLVGKGPGLPHWLMWEDWIAGQPDEFKARDCEPDEVALLLYTSGTTGNPKGVMLSHLNLHSNALNSARSQGLRPGEVNLLVLPLNHSFGITAWLAALVYGMQVVLLSRFDPVEVIRSIDRYQVESSAMVPTMLHFLLGVPERDRGEGLQSLRRIVVGAAPLRLQLRDRFERAYPHIQILEAYGLTEASPGVTVSRPDRPQRSRTVGQSIENQEVRIVDELDNPLGPGQVGEVCTRGPHVMTGYYQRARETAEVLRNGWLHTGDAGYLDEEGYLYLTERLKDLIIRGGENVYPSDVERVLCSHPAIAEAAVIGMPDEIYGEEVVAVVVKRPGALVTERELIAYCEGNLARFQVPKHFLFTHMLPKSPMGKIRKQDLREQFGGVVKTGSPDET